MAGKLKVEILESVEELEHHLQQVSTARDQERLQMLYWLKQGFVQSRQGLAKLLHRNERTLYEWLCQYKQGGIAGLLALKRAPGKASKIPPAALEVLHQKLQEPEGFRSYGEVQQWLAQHWGVSISYPTAHRVVRYRLHSKLKVPRPHSSQADAAAQAEFKKNSQTP